MCDDFRIKFFSKKTKSELVEWFMQRELLEQCDWRDPVKLIKYFDISPRRFSPNLRPVCEMSYTVFKVVFDGVFISSTISLIWRTKFLII